MINPGDHATFTVQPKTGLAAGSYNGTIQITDKDGSIKDGVSVSFEVTEPAPVYNLSVSPENLEFGNAEEGYKNIPEAQTVTVTNTGNTAITLQQPSGMNYTVSSLSKTELNAGECGRHCGFQQRGCGSFCKCTFHCHRKKDG